MRRWLIPETVQTSAMDCGPASLKSLLGGFRIHASYGRLREACQTDLDGASVDTLEETAVALGLDALQVMLPTDHLFLKEADALPALVVVKLPGGGTHFVVVWRVVCGLAQVMDPATGRRWCSVPRLVSELYVHTQSVPAEAWREWAGGEAFLKPLRRRMRDLGALNEEPIAAAVRDVGWRKLAALDAAVRMAAALERSGAARRGVEARRLIQTLAGNLQTIPEKYWPVLPGEDGMVRMRGAVLVHVCGTRSVGAGQPPLSPELAAALTEKPVSPLAELWSALRVDGVVAPTAVTFGMVAAAGSVMVEALLFRGLLDLGDELALRGQRIGAAMALLTFLTGLFLLELPIVFSWLRMGRKLECRLRLRFLRKIPRLSDSYFRSRLVSDMAQRSHAIHQLRQAPELAGRFLRALFELALTATGIAWLFPDNALAAFAAAAGAAIFPLLAQPALAERDLRLRNHLGAISRFYLDAMLGLTAIRAHGAERPLRQQQGALLKEWMRAGLELQRAAVVVQAFQLLSGFGLAAWIVLRRLPEIQAAGGHSAGGILLLIYWALNLPVLGDEIAACAWQYPALRNVLLRVMEPLGAVEENLPLERAHVRDNGARVAFEGVRVVAGGHVILDGIDCDIAPGSHVAIVGPSGAGKSSLVGVLLGWHRAVAGRVLLDGEPLDHALLRRQCAWADPETRLWNRPFLENLHYGSGWDGAVPLASVLDRTKLHGVVENLPCGMQTPLGEAGGLLSGGEGQRVRLGRALLKRDVRLALLDEPARGLDREARRELLAVARERWRDCTMICITHDIGETADFHRVLVLEGGRIVEDGAPCELAARKDGRYRALLEAERQVRCNLWAGTHWRRLRLHRGEVDECR